MPTKFSHMHREHIHLSLQHKFFTMPILPKSKPKFIQQCHNLPTLSKFHELPTLSKFHHDKKNNTPRMLQNQLITQCPKLQQPNDNISPWNFQWNMKQLFSKQRNQRKTHLGVYITIWSMGPRVLKKLILIMPIKCGIIFLTMKSKKRGSLGGRSHLDAKKNGFKKWVSPKMGAWWKCSKTQGSKEILREMDEGRLRSLEKCFL